MGKGACKSQERTARMLGLKLKPVNAAGSLGFTTGGHTTDTTLDTVENRLYINTHDSTSTLTVDPGHVP